MAVRMDVEIDGLAEMRARIRALPRTAQVELRDAAQAIADDEVVRIRRAAAGSSAQSARLAGFIRATRDRMPAISAGGNRRGGFSGGATAGQVFFGAEFGGEGRATTMQFRPHRGREGYFFFPTLREDQDRMLARYQQALAQIEREWAS
ncbi:MAG: hypothetical protein QM753_06790 [Thermomicrobiales bacterium]